MLFRIRYVAASAVMMLVSCFKTPKPECSFACGPNSACPADYTCAADNFCHLRLANNQLGACEFTADASLIDGRPGALERAVQNLLDNACKFAPSGAIGSGSSISVASTTGMSSMVGSR